MKYTLLVSDTVDDLGTKVDWHLGNGWKLYGNPAVALAGQGADRRVVYMQAVTFEANLITLKTASTEQIRKWMENHGFEGSLSDARAAFEDAQSQLL